MPLYKEGPHLRLWFPTCWVGPAIHSVLSHCLSNDPLVVPMSFPPPPPYPPPRWGHLEWSIRVWNNCLPHFFPMPGVSSTHLQRITICSWMHFLIMPEMMILCVADQRCHMHRRYTGQTGHSAEEIQGPLFAQDEGYPTSTGRWAKCIWAGLKIFSKKDIKEALGQVFNLKVQCGYRVWLIFVNIRKLLVLRSLTIHQIDG